MCFDRKRGKSSQISLRNIRNFFHIEPHISGSVCHMIKEKTICRLGSSWSFGVSIVQNLQRLPASHTKGPSPKTSWGECSKLLCGAKLRHACASTGSRITMNHTMLPPFLILNFQRPRKVVLESRGERGLKLGGSSIFACK